MDDLRYVSRYLHGYRLHLLVAALLIFVETIAELVIPLSLIHI